MAAAVGSRAWPVGTFAANIIGSLLIGIFGAMSARFNWPEETRLLLTVGLCGGFTTFSTFSNECLTFLRNGSYLPAALYILGTLGIGILCTCLGYLWVNSD